jgi:hypothetical protein
VIEILQSVLLGALDPGRHVAEVLNTHADGRRDFAHLDAKAARNKAAGK